VRLRHNTSSISFSKSPSHQAREFALKSVSKQPALALASALAVDPNTVSALRTAYSMQGTSQTPSTTKPTD
ncbi:MAG TPA: hypothetical protein PKV55_06370, partial [Nitrospira sp.]|nr:hypothetical protein [Nitrospira sp.]